MAPRVVLITGTSSGIGSGFAKLLLASEEQYRVVGTSRGPLPKDHDLSKEPSYTHKVMDVTSDESVQSIVKEVHEDFGSMDVLVNNAGIGAYGTLEQTDMKRWHEVYETNVFGTVRVTQAALKYMRNQRSGQIVNVSSLAGLNGIPFQDAYHSSKFALEGLTECLACYLHRFGIAVSLVEPGPVSTNFIPIVEADHDYTTSKDDYSTLAPAFHGMMKSVFTDKQYVQTPAEVAAVMLRILEDFPKPKLRYQTSDFVRTLAAFRLKDPTGYSMQETYGRTMFDNQDVIPKP